MEGHVVKCDKQPLSTLAFQNLNSRKKLSEPNPIKSAINLSTFCKIQQIEILRIQTSFS